MGTAVAVAAPPFAAPQAGRVATLSGAPTLSSSSGGALTSVLSQISRELSQGRRVGAA